jgi:hypothetical protein
LFQSATFDANISTPESIPGFGLLSGIDWQDSTDNAWHLMINPDDAFPYVMYVDDYANTADDIPGGDDEGDIATSYITSWFYDDRYVQNKTFVNALYVVKGVTEETQIRVNVYHDFNSNTVAASHTINLTPVTSGGLYGTATYSINGSGGVYGESILRQGIQVGGRLKNCKAVQLEFIGPNGTLTDTPGRAWGINSIAYKYKRRAIRSTK